MKPPMKETITAFIEDTSSIDKYGRHPTVPQDFKARINPTSKVILSADGSNKAITAEIDLPPEAILTSGIAIEYSKFGQDFKVYVEEIVPTLNFGGHRVLFWTVRCA